MCRGVHYKDFHVHGELMPSELDIDSRCSTCLQVLEPLDVEELEKSCSSSSSSEEMGASSAKRAGAGESRDLLLSYDLKVAL